MEKNMIDEHKRFSNWNVKCSQLEAALKYIRNMHPNYDNSLLDLGSGRGNDLNRWFLLGLQNVLGIDSSEEQITIANERYSAFKQELEAYLNGSLESSKIESLLKKYKSGSCTESSNDKNIKIKDPITVNYKLGSIIDESLFRKSDIMTSNYVLNYLNEQELDYFFSLVHKYLNTNGLFIGTLTDGDVILERTGAIGGRTGGSSGAIGGRTGGSSGAIGGRTGGSSGAIGAYETENCSIKMDSERNRYTFLLKNDEDGYFENVITENIIKKDLFESLARKYNLYPFPVNSGTSGILNLSMYPIKIGHQKRPAEIASLFFCFSFLKVSTSILRSIQEPRGLIVVPYKGYNDDQEKTVNKYFHIKKEFIAFMKNVVNKNLDLVIVDYSLHEGFNRGLCIDVAIKNMPDYNYYIIHDIDAIPDKDLLTYYYKYPVGPIHLAPRGTRYTFIPEYKDPLKYFVRDSATKFIGTIISISREHLLQINGFPNDINKWGHEDDLVRDRLLSKGIGYQYPSRGFIVDLEDHDKTIMKDLEKHARMLPDWTLKRYLDKSGNLNLKKMYPEKKNELIREIRISMKFKELPNRMKGHEKLEYIDKTGLNTMDQDLLKDLQILHTNFYFTIVI